MRTKQQIWLNDVSLNDVDPCIIIQTITQPKPAMKTTAVTRGGRIGQYVTQRERTTLDVVVEFAIAEKHDLDNRARILQAVNAWASDGGVLTVSYRQGQRMTVLCDELPDVGNMREWTGTYKLTFRAYDIPYWESSALSVASVSNGVATLYNPGTASAPIEFSATANTSVTSVCVTDANGKKLQFDGLTMASGDVLKLYHNGSILCAKIGNTDVLAKRSTDSSDQLFAISGVNTYTLSTGCTFDVSVRGRWH